MDKFSDDLPTYIREIFKELGDIKETVHRLDSSKQDKIRPAIWLTFILFLMTHTGAGLWWASNIDNSVKNLTITVTETGKDRFYGRDGDMLAQTFELKLSNLRLEMLQNKGQSSSNQQHLQDLSEKFNSLNIQIQECKANLAKCKTKYQISDVDEL